MSETEPIDLIREAAAKMRRLAEGIAPGRWSFTLGADVNVADCYVLGGEGGKVTMATSWPNAGEHITAWDPDAAQAVATMLEDAVWRFECDERAWDNELEQGKTPMWVPRLNKAAIIVARTFLAAAPTPTPRPVAAEQTTPGTGEVGSR